jgi:hypothetical protein
LSKARGQTKHIGSRALLIAIKIAEFFETTRQAESGLTSDNERIEPVLVGATIAKLPQKHNPRLSERFQRLSHACRCCDDFVWIGGPDEGL